MESVLDLAPAPLSHEPSTQGLAMVARVRPGPSSRGAAEPEARRFYRPELDALRFFAFFAVFVHHGIYRFWPIGMIFGGYGLCFFFFLSAFLITELLQREKALAGTVAIPAFYIRRALRIWPLYFGFLAFSAVLGLIMPSQHIGRSFVASFVLMLGNVYIGRHGFPATPVAYLWSISIEEQFYLLWPVLNRLLPRRMLAIVILGLVPVGSAAVLVLAARGLTPALGIWTNSLVQFQFFAFGALAALALRSRIPRLAAGWRLALCASGCLLWLSAARFSGTDGRFPLTGPHMGFGPMLGYWAVGLGCAAFLFSALGVSPGRVPPGLIYLGKISYGLYVFHELSLGIASWMCNHTPGMDSETHHVTYGVGHLAAGFLITLALASVSYRYFEKPFLKWKDAFTVVQSRAA